MNDNNYKSEHNSEIGTINAHSAKLTNYFPIKGDEFYIEFLARTHTYHVKFFDSF